MRNSNAHPFPFTLLEKKKRRGGVTERFGVVGINQPTSERKGKKLQTFHHSTLKEEREGKKKKREEEGLAFIFLKGGEEAFS